MIQTKREKMNWVSHTPFHTLIIWLCFMKLKTLSRFIDAENERNGEKEIRPSEKWNRAQSQSKWNMFMHIYLHERAREILYSFFIYLYAIALFFHSFPFNLLSFQQKARCACLLFRFRNAINNLCAQCYYYDVPMFMHCVLIAHIYT